MITAVFIFGLLIIAFVLLYGVYLIEKEEREAKEFNKQAQQRFEDYFDNPKKLEEDFKKTFYKD